MSIDFNIDEILAVAVRIEQNGARFYTRAADTAATASARALFRGLAALEQVHEKTFAHMRAELTPEERQPTTFDPDHEAGAYLKALADGRVFDVNADPVCKLTGRETARDVLTMAIDLEKDSILFYLGMKDMVPERLGRGKIEDVIKEEMRHIAVLSGELANV